MERTYKVGMKLKFIKDMGTSYLDIANPNLFVHKGEIVTIEKINVYSDHCTEFELIYENKFGEYFLTAWNDYPDHMSMELYFEEVKEDEQ